MYVVLDISYFGENFCGFARQPDVITVQGNLEEALFKVFDKKIETTCAGRTDAGVHAKHQFVSFEIDDNDLKDRSETKIMSYLESLTSDDIHINKLEYKEDEFSARFDAKCRMYSYFIVNQNSPSLFLKDFSWHIEKELDLEAMRQSAKYLVGEHDFKSFCVAASAKNKTTMRNISSIEILNYELFEDNIIEVKIVGNAFLHSMIRNIVGSLIKVGTYNREPEWMKEVLEAKDRQAAGECAPAKGLVLMNVCY